MTDTSASPSALTVIVGGLAARHGQTLVAWDDTSLEDGWLPVLGPTACWLWRRLHREHLAYRHQHAWAASALDVDDIAGPWTVRCEGCDWTVAADGAAAAAAAGQAHTAEASAAFTVTVASLAAACGVSRSDDATAPIPRTIARLCTYDLASAGSAPTLWLLSGLPAHPPRPGSIARRALADLVSIEASP